MTLYGYIRTSRQQVEGVAGGDPQTQELQLLEEVLGTTGQPFGSKSYRNCGGVADD